MLLRTYLEVKKLGASARQIFNIIFLKIIVSLYIKNVIYRNIVIYVVDKFIRNNFDRISILASLL